jgi:hypothetical protein
MTWKNILKKKENLEPNQVGRGAQMKNVLFIRLVETDFNFCHERDIFQVEEFMASLAVTGPLHRRIWSPKKIKISEDEARTSQVEMATTNILDKCYGDMEKFLINYKKRDEEKQKLAALHKTVSLTPGSRVASQLST